MMSINLQFIGLIWANQFSSYDISRPCENDTAWLTSSLLEYMLFGCFKRFGHYVWSGNSIGIHHFVLSFGDIQ